MFLRQTTKPKGTYLAIVESVYDSSKKISRQRTVEGIGYLEDLKKQYDDPIAYFSQKAADMTAEKKAEASGAIPIDFNALMDTEEDNMLNVGYGIFKQLYKELELDKFFNWKTRNLSIKYSPDQIFRLLVFSRLLYPGSKKETYENRDIYFEGFDSFSLDDVISPLSSRQEKYLK